MQLSVVILNYNVRYFLELCVLSVQDALKGVDAEIIIVDNNSSDDSCEMLKNHFPHIKLIKNTENVGFPKGNNIGVAVAKGEYVCILNPDTVVAEDTFKKALAFAKEQKELGIVGVKLVDGCGSFLPESKRGVPTPFVAFTKMAGLYKIFPNSNLFGKYYAQHLQQDQSGEVEILVGAFMLLKRKLYQDLQGFDENCFMYSDDIDLSYRATLLGKTNFYYAGTTVIHFKGESTLKDGVYMQRFQDAMQFFYKKHFKVSVLFSLFMKVGIFLFALKKKLEGKQKNKREVATWHLYSNNEDVAKSLSKFEHKKVVFHDLKTEKMVISYSVINDASAQIVIDTHAVQFKECIAFVESVKNKGLTFRILPKSTNFLIGSDNSKERGEIIKISR
ncbi:glycosyltransferase family 2 protein [Flavobacterium sp.]|uniref:glycosyltransferase family 2 protein n=1 Tax=Flavobacterium sp. TaxID=239 RepID=UPI00260FFCEF|nr:glycosyltransferase family 2 protein [Flavobacterium sp.]MDG2431339.1 glycosyltransferase family 2 protein [Flavobacterium sp.]